jgi:hypothetical protein
METHVPRGLMTTCGVETQRLSQFVHGRRLRSFGVDEIRVVRGWRVVWCRRTGHRGNLYPQRQLIQPAPPLPRSQAATAPATSANTITPRQMINGSLLRGLIDFCYTALGLRGRDSHVRPGWTGVRDRPVKEERCEVREMLQPYIDKSRSVECQASSPTPAKTRTNRWWGKRRTRPPATDQGTDRVAGTQGELEGTDRGGDHRLDEADK